MKRMKIRQKTRVNATKTKKMILEIVRRWMATAWDSFQSSTIPRMI